MHASAVKKQPLGTHLGTHEINGRDFVASAEHNLGYSKHGKPSLLSIGNDASMHLAYVQNNLSLTRDNVGYFLAEPSTNRSDFGCMFLLPPRIERGVKATASHHGAESETAMSNQKYQVPQLQQYCYSVADAAVILGLSESSVRRLIDRGDLGVVYPTSEMRVTANAIIRYVERLEDKARTTARAKRCAHRKVVR